MKLRSTLLFAAASLTASALAPVEFAPVAYAAGESISVNFASGRYGASSAMGENWNDTTGANGTVNSLKDSTGSVTGASLTFSSGGVWGWENATAPVLEGYLDDHSGGSPQTIKISVSNISYLAYGVTVLVASDSPNTSFSAKTINGVSYYGADGQGVAGNQSWGASQELTINSNNSFTVSGLSGDLSILSDRNGVIRGSIAGFIITDTYAGSSSEVSLSGSTVTWTNNTIGDVEWINSTPDAGTYANFDVTADSVVNVTEDGITTDAIMVSGSGKVTLSGGALSLIGPATISSTGASLVIENELMFAEGGIVKGAVSTVESGSLNVLGGTLQLRTSNLALAVKVDEGAVVDLGNLTGAKSDASLISGTGIVLFNAQPTNHSAGVKLGDKFTGTVRVSGNANLPRDSELGGATKIILDNAYLWTGETATFDQDVEVFGITTNYDKVGVNKQRGYCNITYTGTFTLTENSSFAFEQGTTTFDGEFIGKSGSALWSGATLTFNEKTTLQTLNVKGGTTTFNGGNDSSVDTINLGGTVVFSKNTSETNSTYSVGGIFAPDSAYGGSLTVDSDVTVNAKTLSSNWGMGTLTINGVLNLSETLRLSSASAEMITGDGTINTEQLNLRNAGKYQLSGGITINLGSGGILQDQANGWNIRIGDATLGATADWKTVGVDDGRLLLNSTENGGAKFDTTGGNIEITTTLSDYVNDETTEKGALSKLGTGTLILSGANSYSGGTTISAGTLVAANASAFGTGNVTLSGGELVRATSEQLAIGGSFTVENGVALDLGLVSATAGAISASGDVSLGKNITFDISLTEGESSVVLLSSSGSLTSQMTGEEIVKALYIDGALINQNSTVTIESNSISLSIATAQDIVWNGGVNGEWKVTGDGWTKDGVSTSFQNGDNVTFGSDASVKTVTISAPILTGSITISGDYTFSGNYEVSAKTVSVAENVKLTLSDVSLVVGDSITLGTGVKLSGNGRVELKALEQLPTGDFLDNDWSGTVSLSGKTGLVDFLFSDYAVNGSSVEVSGLSGYFKGGQNSSPVVLEEGQKLILTNAEDGTSAFTMTNGSSPNKYVFNGSIVGSGTFEHKWGNAGALTYEFNGDVSGWNGLLKHNGTSSTTNSVVFKKGNVNVDIENIAGPLNLRFEASDTSSDMSYTGVISGNANVNLWVDSGTLVWTGQRNQAAGNITIASGATLDVSDSRGKLYSTSAYSNGQVSIQGTLKVCDYTYGGSLGYLKTNGNGTEIVIIDGGKLVFTDSHSADRATIVSENGGSVSVESGASVKLTGNTNGNAFTTKGGTLTFEGEGNLEISGAQGVITGAAAVVKSGTGTLVLSGTNTYTGGTTISGGTLKVTQDAALSTGPVALEENGVLEFTYNGFARAITGTGTLAKSSSDELEYDAGGFVGSFDVRSGALAVTAAKDQAFKNLKISSGATFKANQNVSFATIDASGTLSGANFLTRVSVESGTFAGTLSSVALVKTGSGNLDLANAKFAEGGKVVVEAGTASNLVLADGGTLQLSGESAGQITLNNLTLGTGTIIVDELFDETTAMATISGLSGDASNVTLTLDISGIGYKTTYALFTFDSESKSAWESIFGTLTDGKFNNNLVLNGGVGTTENGIFSWNENTLCFYENREAKEFTWIAANGSGTWNFTDDNWNQPPEAFVNNMAAIFSATAVGEGYYAQDKNVTVSVAEEVRAATVTVDVGDDGYLSIEDKGGVLKVANGVTVESGTLNLISSGTEFYTGAIVIGGDGMLVVTPTEAVSALTLENKFSGTGTIQYGTSEKKLTLSGDRSKFTGTLDVNAGTVVLANGTGTEAFSSIDIAEGATVAANGGTAVDGFSTLTLGQVSGTGTLNVSAQGAKFFALDLSGSGFTGTVELDAVDMVWAMNPSEAMVTSVSNLANASSVRLTNGASLNFFNEASTFDKNIEVAETNGAIRVYGNNAGTTLSGNISGAGTLTVKDGGKLILSGAVGTAESALGGLTLSAGSLEISGENSSLNISGNVVLSGVALPEDADIPTATINTTGNIGGNVVLGGTGIMTQLVLGGDLTVGGDLTLEATSKTGRVMTVLSDAEISVSGTTAFKDNESLIVEDGAIFSSGTVSTSTWGFNATLGAGATLSAGTLTFGKDTDSVSGAAEGDASRIEIGREDGTGTLSGTVIVKDITIGVREGATAWSSDANVKLNGGATTFDVGEGQEITLNGTLTEAVETAQGTEGEEGYVAATSSQLVKDGAGTLTLGKANANKGGTQLNAGTLKFTNTDGVTLSGSYAFAGGALAAGEGTTLSLGAGATFSGAVVYTNDKNGKLLVSEDFSITGEGNSLTLHEKANVEIASGKTLSLGALSFTGNGSKIEGAGTLSLAGTVTVDNNRTNTITSDLALSEDTVLAISKGTLEIESEDISTGGKTLTKTGAGTLTLDTDAVYDFDGSFSLQGGTVDIGSRELTISGTHSFELASKATLEGDLVLEKGSSATLGAGTIKGDVTLSGATLSFTGKTTVEGALSWTDSNTITLDAEFRKTITSTPYTLISFASKEGDNANLTFTDVETYGRRSFTLDIGDTKIDLLATGTLVWNANVATWTTNADEEADWTLEQTAGNTTSAFFANDYVEFRDSGSIVIADDTIQTSGVVFNLNGNFRLNAPTPARDEAGQPTEEQKIVTLTDAVYGDDNTTGKSAGLTVVAGNVTIGNYIVNDLSSVTISSGSLTVFNVDALGIVDKTDSANEKIATLTIGGGVNDDGTPKSATLNISLPGDDAKTEDVNESVGVIDQKVAIVNAGVISVVNANTTVEISGAISGADAKLTKTGWGALKITRDSTLGALAVDSGYLELVGNADAALSIKSVEVGNQGEMVLVGDTDGANTTFDALAVSGKLTVTDGNTETLGLGAYRTGTLQGSGNISGNLYIGADTGFDITTNNTDGSTTTTNYKGTAVSGNLTLTGSIASYGTEDAALYKKGTGTLTLVSAEKENDVPKAFTLDASVVHEAGTLAFTHGGVISENYTVAENAAATLRFNGANASELSAGLTLGAGSRTTIENSGDGSLKINGISSSGTTATTLAGKNITLSGDAVDFGSLSKIDGNTVLSALYVNAENVEVEATTFSAGYVAFGNGASLAISSGTTATANALYVGENAFATLDLTGGAKFSVGTEEKISVFGGTGTLNVAGGTLELKGATYGDKNKEAPSIVLDDATLAFNVTGADASVAAYLDGVSTADGSTGTIEKTGTGTLIVLDTDLDGDQDLDFDGKISVSEGDMTLFATASQADVEIADGAALEFAGIAELADSIEGVNTLAESLSGAGTLHVAGELYVNANSAFDGTIKASGGTLYVSGATSDWMANGTDRALALESISVTVETEINKIETITVPGTIATYDESATLTAVSLSGRKGIFLGAAEDKALTVQNVSATAGSYLTLEGYGTLGAMKFDEANGNNAIVVASDADWTINGASENLGRLSVSGSVTVADTRALGSANVLVLSSGKIIFDAEGTYANTFELGNGAFIEAKKNTSLTGTLNKSGELVPAVTFVADKNVKLTLSDSVLDWTTPTFKTEDATATIAVNVTSSVKTLSKLSGAGTFEKLGDKTLSILRDAGAIGAVAVKAGTLDFGATAKLAVAEGGEGKLSVAKDATLKLAGTKLGDWTLTGEGSAEISGSDNALAAISSATNVALSGTLDLSGDISASKIAFGSVGAKLTAAGTAAQSIAGTTFSGETVTLVNENKAGVTVASDAVFEDSVKTLVLTADSGINGAVMDAAYADSLTKTLDGEWTVSDYTFGKTADQKLTVSGGTLVWKGVKLEANAGAIDLGDSATLKINGLASGDTLKATIDGAGTLEIAATGTSATPLKLETTAANDSAWKLHVSGGSYVKTEAMLPGDLWVEGENSVFELALAPNEAETVSDGKRYQVSKEATLKLSGEGTLKLEGTGDSKNPHSVSGTIDVAAGTFVQNGNIQWDPNATVNIGENGKISIDVASAVNNNNATFEGTGTLEIAKTGATPYRFGGKTAGFEGKVAVASGAKAELSYELFDSAEVDVQGELTVAISGTTQKNRELKNISGTGTLVIDTPVDFYTRYGIYTYNTTDNDFGGTVKVESGVLSFEVAGLGALKANKVEVGGAKNADYYEGNWAGEHWDGITAGGFLQLKNGNDFDAASLFATGSKFSFSKNAGTIYSGGTFKANSNFGSGKDSLFVVDAATTLTLTDGADIDGSLLVKHDGELVVDYTVAGSGSGTVIRANSAAGGNSGITGDLTLNGDLRIVVTDDAINNGALFGVGGKVALSTDGGDATKIELEVTGTEDLDGKRVVILGGKYDGNVDLSGVVEVTDTNGNSYKVARDANGQIVILNSATEYTDIPSGLSELATVIRDAKSPLWDYVQADLAQSEERLVGLSPVSYGSLVEMQSGFAALENDLLRDRLEQRRYERAFVSDREKTFKPFVNLVGSEREGDGNGTESANYDISHTGLLGGFDVAVSRNTIFGVSLGFDFAKADVHNGGGKHEGDSTRLGVYGMTVFDNAYFGYGISAGATSFETKRNSGYNGESLTGTTDGNDINASFLFGAGWTLDENLGIDIAPYVGLDFGYASTQSFEEEGGKQSALDIDKLERLSLRGKLGATLSWRATDRLRLSLDAAFSHEFLDSDIDIDATFAKGDLKGKSFSSTAYLMDENTIQIGPRVDYRIDDTWSVSGGYSYETDLDDTATHSANVGFRARF